MKNGSLRHWGRSTSNNVVRQPQTIDELSSTPALQVALGASLSLGMLVCYVAFLRLLITIL